MHFDEGTNHTRNKLKAYYVISYVGDIPKNLRKRFDSVCFGWCRQGLEQTAQVYVSQQTHESSQTFKCRVNTFLFDRRKMENKRLFQCKVKRRVKR